MNGRMVFSNIHTAHFSLDMINRLNTENDFHSVSERGQGKKWREKFQGDGGVDVKSGRQGTNEISQLWFDLSHVMAGPPSLTPFLQLSLLHSPSP